MRGINKVILIGNATRDAELRYTKSGKPVAHVGLATNRQVNGSEVTHFHSIIAWDKLAEIASQYVNKGRQLYVEGRLEYRKFTNKDGQEKEVAEIIASDIQFLGSKDRGDKDIEAPAASDDVDPNDVPF